MRKFPLSKLSVALSVVAVSLATQGYAAQEDTQSPAVKATAQQDDQEILGNKLKTSKHSKIKTLDEVVVYGNRTMTNKMSVTNQDMQIMPGANGNINDYLVMNPHVRFKNEDQNAAEQGEIKPDDISINGADTNQTAFFVDNVNINNDTGLDPTLFDGSVQVVPGLASTQAYFFDASMLQRVEVQDANISASLGGFMGGAIIAKTKQYNGTNSYALNYRTTSSHWANMQKVDAYKNTLEKLFPTDDDSSPIKVGATDNLSFYQPTFTKHFVDGVIEQKLTDNLGMVLGLSRRNSTITQMRIVDRELSPKTADYVFKLSPEKKIRRSDNVLFNLKWTPTLDDRLELSTRYSKYLQTRDYAKSVNNNIKDYHQAVGATLAWVHQLRNSTLTNTLALDHFSDDRESNSAINNTVFNGDYDYISGGYGNNHLKQDNIHYSVEWAHDPIDWGGSTHALSIGAIYQGTRYKYQNDQDVTGLMNDYPIGVTRAGKVSTNYSNFALYGEDSIKWGKFEFRPGLRIERNTYLRNTDIAPRFVIRYSPFSQTLVTAGLNRYYGRSFASFKLTNEILKLTHDGLADTHQRILPHLKTPRTDELMFSVRQGLGPVIATLGINHRNYKDRILMLALPNPAGIGTGTYSFKNGHNFKVTAYSLILNNATPWKLGKTRWDLTLSFDYLKSGRILNSTNPDDIVYLDNKLMTRAEMDRKVNQRQSDWIARLAVDMTVPDYNFTWTNQVSLKAPIRYAEQLSDQNAVIDRYRTINFGKIWEWNMGVRWEPTIWRKLNGYVQVDIMNVLNQQRKSYNQNSPISMNTEYGIYNPGRQFWLRVGMKW